jgi:hypothetical protein
VSATTTTLGVIAALLFVQSASFAAEAPNAPAPVVADPRAVAVDRALRNEAGWSLAYVDRPQTLYEGMESFAFTGRQLFGPAGYSRSIFGVGYSRGLTDSLELGLGVARLLCTGSGLGACQSRLAPTLSLQYAAITAPKQRLALGASVSDFVHDVRAWARLKLVAPSRFSFEIQPTVSWGVETVRAPAWWNPAVTQDGNQSRLSVVFDANLQLGERVVAWLDGIPYAPTARLDDLSTTALEVGGGLSVSVTKGLELAASCWRYDVLATRHWEYVPDVYECMLSVVARRFGPSPEPGFETVAYRRGGGI